MIRRASQTHTTDRDLSERIEIRIAGRGGQGILMASNVLAHALEENYEYIAKNGSYGSDARGTVSTADVVAGPEPFSYPKVETADVLALLAPEAAGQFASTVVAGGIVLADPDLVPKRFLTFPEDVSLYLVPAARKASELGSPLHLNMLLVGAISTVLGSLPGLAIRPGVFRGAVKQLLSTKRAESALTAFDVGRSLVNP
jgi:2-oxoglutarate ferredoxin oxidoreductase subunit gamma